MEEIGAEESRSIMDDHFKAEKAKGDDTKHVDLELPLTNVRITVQEGKYRMVRRMLANCKHPVIELRRERHGNVELKDLKEGEFRECDESEIEWAEGLLKG